MTADDDDTRVRIDDPLTPYPWAGQRPLGTLVPASWVQNQARVNMFVKLNLDPLTWPSWDCDPTYNLRKSTKRTIDKR
jgi:hypothetical protein